MINKLFSSPLLAVGFVVLFPFLVGGILNFEFIDWGIFAVSVLWMFVLFLPYYITRKKWLFVLAVVFPFLMGTADLFHWIILYGPLSVTSLFILFETNLSEARDFMETYFSIKLLLGMSFYVFGSLFLIYKAKMGDKSKKSTLFMGLGALAFLIIFSQKMLIGRADLAFPSLPVAMATYFEEIKKFKEEAGNRDVKLEKLQAVALQDTLEEIHVLIIGESLNRNHTSLYGYAKNTTPRLVEMQSDLLVYNDVISANTSTLKSLKLVLTTSNNQNDVPYYQAYSIIDFARVAGYATYWISNQPPIGIWDNAVSALANTCDYVDFVNKTGESTRAMNLYSYDEKLIPSFSRVLDKKEKKKLVVLHMMGSHMVYRKRYPQQFEFFKVLKEDNEKERFVKEYDNSVYYTDYVVSELITMLKKEAGEDKISSLLFFSDHGEDVYDKFEGVGHNSNQLSRHQLEIPFFVWLSPQYKKQYANKVQYMQSNVDAKYFCDDLEHGFADLMRISSDHILPKCSPFDSSFQFKERVLYGKNYDLELRD